jgi:hypothetical protein
MFIQRAPMINLFIISIGISFSDLKIGLIKCDILYSGRRVWNFRGTCSVPTYAQMMEAARPS